MRCHSAQTLTCSAGRITQSTNRRPVNSCGDPAVRDQRGWRRLLKRRYLNVLHEKQKKRKRSAWLCKHVWPPLWGSVNVILQRLSPVWTRQRSLKYEHRELKKVWYEKKNQLRVNNKILLLDFWMLRIILIFKLLRVKRWRFPSPKSQILYMWREKFLCKFKGKGKTQLCDRDGWRLTWEQRWGASWQRWAGALTTLPVLGVEQWRQHTTGHPEMQSRQTSCWQQILRICFGFFYHYYDDITDLLLLFGTYLLTDWIGCFRFLKMKGEIASSTMKSV